MDMDEYGCGQSRAVIGLLRKVSDFSDTTKKFWAFTKLRMDLGIILQEFYWSGPTHFLLVIIRGLLNFVVSDPMLVNTT